jgi:hypothetical protein
VPILHGEGAENAFTFDASGQQEDGAALRYEGTGWSTWTSTA